MPVNKPVIDKSRCALFTSAKKPLQGSSAGKTKANNCGDRCRALDKALIHKSELSASHCELPDSELPKSSLGASW